MTEENLASINLPKWSGNNPIAINGANVPSGAAPALMQFPPAAGYLYLVYASADTSKPSLWQLAYDGSGWQQNAQITFGTGSTTSYPQSLCTPALAVIGKIMYLAYIQPSGQLAIAALQYSVSVSAPQPATSWVNSSQSGPTASTSSKGLSMVVYPYNGTPSLWIFYVVDDAVQYAVATPAGTSVSWTTHSAISVSGSTPKTSYFPAAALPNGAPSNGAPYVVYPGTGSGNTLNYLYYDASSGAFSGNQHLPMENRKKKEPESNGGMGFVVPPGSKSPAVLIYKGRHTNQLNIAMMKVGGWWTLNLPIWEASLFGVDPNTSIGVGIGLYIEAASKSGTLVMAYPDTQSNKYLYAAFAEMTE